MALACGVLCLALLSGCSSSRITTEIRPDGSWVRTDVFTGPATKEAGQMGSTLDDVFAVPAGPSWKASEEKKGDNRILTALRTLAAGEVLSGDVSLKGGKPGELKMINEVRVTRAGPHRFEYRETLHWKTERPDLITVKPEDIAAIKAALPPALATGENARALANKASDLMIPVMFGPGDPLLAMGLIHPDLAERRARQRLGALMLTALQQQFGDKLGVEERREIARKLIANTLPQRPSTPDPSASSSKDSLTPLMFVMRMPGRVVSSNGELDDLSGEVYWALFPEAASIQDVVLAAICEIPPGSRP